MRKILIYVLCGHSAIAQPDSVQAVREIHTFQAEQNKEFKDREKSPLEPKALKKFKGHDFYPIDLKYRVTARLTVTSDSTFFIMKTTTPRLPKYRVYGIMEFTMGGKVFLLPVYQSEDLMKKAGYADYLFFPFTDLTNGEDTYGGGRYIGLRIPRGNELTLDFNQAYNPYCAYSPRFSCPIVPSQNHMDIGVTAGVRYAGSNKH